MEMVDHLKLAASLRNGIEKDLRPRVWFWLSGNRTKIKELGKDYY